jgi:hypothetical protein
MKRTCTFSFIQKKNKKKKEKKKKKRKERKLQNILHWKKKLNQVSHHVYLEEPKQNNGFPKAYTMHHCKSVSQNYIFSSIYKIGKK